MADEPPAPSPTGTDPMAGVGRDDAAASPCSSELGRCLDKLEGDGGETLAAVCEALRLMQRALAEKDGRIHKLEAQGSAYEERVRKLEAELQQQEAGGNGAAGGSAVLSAEDANAIRHSASVVERVMRGGVLVVDHAGAGMFRDIPAALAVARSGDVVVVRPGVYRDPLVLDTDGVELRGVSEENTVLQHDAEVCTLVFRASATVRHMAIHGAGPHNSAVRFEGGDGTLANCIVTSANLSCIVVVQGAPTISRCKAHGSQQHGVCCKHHTSPIIEYCEVYGNKQPNVVVDQHAAPTIRGCTIHTSQQNGVWFRSNSGGVLEDSEVYANQYSNVDISAGATPVVRRNTIRGSEKCGVCVADRAGGLIEDNEIHSNMYSNIGIMSDATPTVLRNTIHSSKQHGILVKASAGGTIANNALHNNYLANIKLEQGAHTTVQGNTR